MTEFEYAARNLKFESYNGGRDSKERLTQVYNILACDPDVAQVYINIYSYSRCLHTFRRLLIDLSFNCRYIVHRTRNKMRLCSFGYWGTLRGCKAGSVTLCRQFTEMRRTRRTTLKLELYKVVLLLMQGSIQQSILGSMLQPQSPYSQMNPTNKFITCILFEPQDVACK